MGPPLQPSPYMVVFRGARQPRRVQNGRRVKEAASYGDAPSVGAHVVRPLAAKGRPYGASGPSIPVGADVLIGPQKGLPLTREVAFAKQMTEGETGRTMRAPCGNPHPTQ